MTEEKERLWHSLTPSQRAVLASARRHWSDDTWRPCPKGWLISSKSTLRSLARKGVVEPDIVTERRPGTWLHRYFDSRSKFTEAGLAALPEIERRWLAAFEEAHEASHRI